MYYPVWQASSPRKKATNSTTTSSKVPASTASPASFIKPTSVPPRNSPRWFAIAPPPFPWPPPPASLACPPPSGPPLSKPASGTCSAPSGPRYVPDPRPLTTYCWQPSTASASPAPRPKSPIGIAPPFCRHCGSFLRSASLRKRSGTPLNRSCPKDTRRSPRPTTPWSKLSCVCWDYGKRSNW